MMPRPNVQTLRKLPRIRFGVLFNSFHLNASQGLAPEFNWTKQELLDTYSAHPDLPAKYAVQAGKVLLTGDALSREDCLCLLQRVVAIFRHPGFRVLALDS